MWSTPLCGVGGSDVRGKGKSADLASHNAGEPRSIDPVADTQWNDQRSPGAAEKNLRKALQNGRCLMPLSPCIELRGRQPRAAVDTSGTGRGRCLCEAGGA